MLKFNSCAVATLTLLAGCATPQHPVVVSKAPEPASVPVWQQPRHVSTHLLGVLSRTPGEVPRVVTCSDTSSCVQALAPATSTDALQPGEMWIIVTAHENAIQDIAFDGTTLAISLSGHPCSDGGGHILYATSSIYRLTARDVLVQVKVLPTPDCGPTDGQDIPRNKPAQSNHDGRFPVRFHAVEQRCSAGGEEEVKPYTTSLPAPPEPSPLRANVGVFDSSGNLVATVNTDFNGNATMWLAPGSYWMDSSSLSGFTVDKQGIVKTAQDEAWITIDAGVIQLWFFKQCPG